MDKSNVGVYEPCPIDMFQNTAYYFFESLRVGCSQPCDQLVVTGSLGSAAAWELRSDLVSRGRELIGICKTHLNPAEVDAITEYLLALERLPDEVFNSGQSGSNDGLLHTSWTAHKVAIISLLLSLRPRVREIYDQFDLTLDWYQGINTRDVV